MNNESERIWKKVVVAFTYGDQGKPQKPIRLADLWAKISTRYLPDTKLLTRLDTDAAFLAYSSIFPEEVLKFKKTVIFYDEQ
jgi:hypothetical protein